MSGLKVCDRQKPTLTSRATKNKGHVSPLPFQVLETNDCSIHTHIRAVLANLRSMSCLQDGSKQEVASSRTVSKSVGSIKPARGIQLSNLNWIVHSKSGTLSKAAARVNVVTDYCSAAHEAISASSRT